METIYIIKLGGAAITDKTKDYTLRPDVLSRVMNEISFSDRKAIIVHGAGSFAHNIAKEYSLANGESPEVALELQYKGITVTRRSLLNLHTAVLDAATNANLLPFSFPVSSIFVSNGEKHLYSKFLDSLDEALNQGFTPVLYGDISFDVETKFRVISGDRIIKVLVEHFKTMETWDDRAFTSKIKVIFGSNVDGLFDKDPDIDGAKLIENITNDEISNLIEMAGDSAGTDVTGGMKGKLTEIKGISDLGAEVQIVNITEENRMYQALINETGIRSIISAKE